MTYPDNWPPCICGQPVLDGKDTCGDVNCVRLRTRALVILQNIIGGKDAPLYPPKPVFICTKCGTHVYYERSPGPCPTCGAQRPN